MVYFNRILDLDPPKQQVILADQKRLDVDSARFRITDPLEFYKLSAMSGCRSRLSTIINGPAPGAW